jgi:glutamate synthase (NADPH) small chain
MDPENDKGRPKMDKTNRLELNLVIPRELQETMQQRSILAEDVKKVIDHSIASGERFFNPEDSSYLAALRINNMTCWVRYTEKENGIHITSVYSHRLEIVEE